MIVPIICLLILFIGLAIVLLNINDKLSQIGTGLFIFGLCAFVFTYIGIKLSNIPIPHKEEFYSYQYENIDELAELHNATVIDTYNYAEERLVHKYTNKDSEGEWIYYKVPEMTTSATSETTVETEPEITREIISTITISEDED